MTTFFKWIQRACERFIPLSLLQDPESVRKARLIVYFGFLGGAFGFTYASFYFLIGHTIGTVIIILCSTCAVSVPFLLRSTGSLRLAGNFQALILTLGFFSLATVEGGVHGHAIAWLAAVPLCALLLADKRAAFLWCIICFFATSYYCILDLCGITLPLGYASHLHSLVTAVGFVGLAIFMSILGMVFEYRREKAFKKLEDAHTDLCRVNEQLIRLNQERDEFLGVVAHDLKNRIHDVKGLAELLSATPHTPGPQKIHDDAGEIIHAAIKMQEVVGNLLAMDAIQEGRFQLTPQVCDLGQFARRVIRNYHPAAERKKVEIEFSLPPDPVLITADADATVQVLDNLLSNAVKYSPFEKRINIKVEDSLEGPAFVIADEGQGFSESDKKRLFHRFARLSARPTAEESSTGLGLSIVKNIVEAMGGSVRCESAQGAGATFVVTFPRGG